MEFKQYFKIFKFGMDRFKLIGPDLLGFYLLEYLFRFFWVIPEIGFQSNFLLLFDLFNLVVVVKDTPSRPLFWPLIP